MSIMDPDFNGGLEIMSANFHKHKDRIKLPSKPPWLKEDDDLSKLYSELPVLMKRGEVYYSCLV